MHDSALLAAIDALADVMRADPGEGQGPTPGSYVEWLSRMRGFIAADPDGEEGATARRRIHAALVCGRDHTPLERAWTRYRSDADLRAILETIEALTTDPMYPCPCCACLTLPEKPPNSWARCPVCGWMDDGVEGGGANPPIVDVREAFMTRSAPPRRLRDPRPEEVPPDSEN